jgi:hypothetical protein
MALLDFETVYGDGLPTAVDVVKLFGGYWSDVHQHRTEVRAYGHALSINARDVSRLLTQFVGGIDHNISQALDYVTYFPVRVPISSIKKVAVTYGEGFAYGDLLNGSTLTYGATKDYWWELPLPENIKDFAAVLDKPCNSDFVAVNSADAVLRPVTSSILLSVEDPLKVFSGIGGAPEGYVTVWLYMAGMDNNKPARQFARQLSLTAGGYLSHAAIKSFREAIATGASELVLRQYISGAVNCPVAAGREKVEHIVSYDNTYTVITDKQSYVGAKNDAPAVNIDDEVAEGDFLFSSVKFTTFEQGIPEWLEYLELPNTFFGTTGNVFISAGDLPVTYLEGEDGKLKVRFPIQAAESDHAIFWDKFDAAESVMSPRMSARIAFLGGSMITTDNLNGSQGTLPSEANILELLAKSWLRYTMSLAQVDVSRLTKRVSNLLRQIGEVVPPWVSHVMQYVGQDIDPCQAAHKAHASTSSLAVGVELPDYTDLDDSLEVTCCQVDMAYATPSPDNFGYQTSDELTYTG